MELKLEARSQAKLLLFGEHAAVYGYPALGLPLDLSCRVGWIPEGEEILLRVHGKQASAEELGFFYRMLDIALDEVGPLPQEPEGIWNITSTVPEAGGFGSSAALCSAFARLYLELRGHKEEGVPVDPKIWRLATRLESIFHGRSSGIDTALSLSQSALFMEPGGSGQPGLSLREVQIPDLPLVYGALPRSGSSVDLIYQVARHPDRDRSMEELGQISRKAHGILLNPSKSYEDLKFLIMEAQEILALLGLSRPEMDEILKRSRDFGFHAGKISGAGGGGAFFLFAKDPAQMRSASEALEAALRKDGIELALGLRPIQLPQSQTGQ